ncbi:MAG: TolC family protein [Bacteroidales bacterium]|nr:TolC family protein [Bacteroidales bacterium]
MNKNYFLKQPVFTCVWFAILFLLVWQPVQAQEISQYTLKEVIRLAQDQSPDAQIARHRFKSSYWRYRNFKAEYLPNLSFEGQLPDINRSFGTIQLKTGTFYTYSDGINYDATLSLTQKVGLTGGDVFISSGLGQMTNYYSDSTSSSSSEFRASIINIGFNQPIFKYNKYKWDKQIEPMQYEEAKRVLIEANEEVASVAVDCFFSLLVAQVDKDISLKNRSNYDTLYRIAKGRYQLGKIAENDLLQLELNLLQADASVEDAELSYETKLSEFKSYLRLKNDNPIMLIPPGETNHFIVPANEAIEQAQNNSSDGIAFQRRLIVAESKVNEARMDGRFDANVYAVLGLTQRADFLSDVYKNPKDEERVKIGITVPILDWGYARGRIKLAESNQDLEVESVEQERVDYIQNIFVNVMQFNMQKNQLRIAAKSDTVAQKRYDVTEKRYKIGKINDVIDLNKAQIDNDNAKIGYYRSLMTYWKSYYQIRKMTLYDFEHDRPIQVPFEDLIR